MRDKDILIIFSTQEYKVANHQNFWNIIANKVSETTDVVIIDILADLVITKIRGKDYRIQDHKKGLVKLGDNLYLFRPMTFIRPEVLPRVLQTLTMKTIKKQLSEVISNFDIRNKIALFYDCNWGHTIRILDSKIKMIYFIYDEVTLNASNGREIKGIREKDYESCMNADIILTMTQAIADRRREFLSKVIVIGNGAVYKDILERKSNRISKSVAFIGNFRDWIDFSILEEIIVSRPDWMFCFAGPIEKNVEDKFEYILNSYSNTLYLGKFSKDNMEQLYNIIEVVIVPYKDNIHIKSTRPIKIVESIFNKTPVVTVPMDGYNECEFIRFARSSNEFLDQIEFLMNNNIDWDGEIYKKFIMENSWESKAELMINAIKEKQ